MRKKKQNFPKNDNSGRHKKTEAALPAVCFTLKFLLEEKMPETYGVETSLHPYRQTLLNKT